MGDSRDNTFLFIIWSAARDLEGRIVDEIRKRFRIVRSFEVSWPKRHFVKNLASFYGWKSWRVWWNKARKCGRGPFLAIVVEDPHPVWRREYDTSGHEMVVDENVYLLKKQFRVMTGHSNVVHSSVTPEETAHQLAALSEPCDSPIPFREMRYRDDDRIRAERRAVCTGLILDIAMPLLVGAITGTIIWIDLFVMKSGCAEGHLVELSELAITASCGVLMTLFAFRRKARCGTYALFAALFFDITVREADYLLDRVFAASVWPWVLMAITLTFVAVTFRYAKTVYPGLKEIRSSRLFPLFACGVSLVILTSFLSWVQDLCQSPGVQAESVSGKHMEESVELFGYALMFAWTLSLVRLDGQGRRQTRERGA